MEEPIEASEEPIEASEEPMDTSDVSSTGENTEIRNAAHFPDTNGPQTPNTVKCDNSNEEESQDSEIQEVESVDLQDPLKISNSDIEERGDNSNPIKISEPAETIIIQSDSEPECNEISNKTTDSVKRNETKGNNFDANENENEGQSVRRSSRTISKIIYDEDSNTESEDESEAEEFVPIPVKQQAITISSVGKNTKTLKKSPSKIATVQNRGRKRKQPDLLGHFDSNHNNAQNALATSQRKSKAPKLSASIYSKMASQGTTITLVNGKNNSIALPPKPPTPPPPILPSLTDDMFVVEAPSFIVPYVYEKPSLKPFRKFVDELGKEVEEELKKVPSNDISDENQTNVTKPDENLTNEENTESVTEKLDAVDSTSKKASKRRRRKYGDDDTSWDGEPMSSDSDGENNKVEIIKAEDDVTNHIKKVTTDINSNKPVVRETESYFDCTLGQFFINIGMNLVQEYVQKYLLDQQNRKLRRDKKLGKDTIETRHTIELLSQNLECSQERNEPFKFSFKKCKMCNFRTESEIVLSHHLESPHFQNNIYFCNKCQFQNRSPYEMLCHMDTVHKIPVRLDPPPSYNECPNCPYEDNRKNKYAKHLLACNKKYKPELNLMPPLEWEPPAKIPKIVPQQKLYGFPKASSTQLQMMRPFNQHPYFLNANVVNKTLQTVVALQNAALLQNNLMLQNSAATVSKKTTNQLLNSIHNKSLLIPKAQSSPNPPSISIIPLPRQPTPPAAAQASSVKPKEAYVTCEICDGFIQNLEMLRSHLQWIHQIKVHPKLMQNRPPLNCQKCQFRFFTDQGLERHLLGSHGLVTTSMQEASDAGKDAGRCPICGRVFNWNLLSHVAKDHNVTLKPAHLSYKCTVCTATFSQYKQFENHVYSSHSAIARLAVDKNKNTSNVQKPVNVAKPSTSTFRGK